MTGFRLATMLAAGLLVQPASAADYKPVRCTAAAPYVGKLLDPAPRSDMLPSAAPATTPFDAATTARLEAALTTALGATKARAMTVAVAKPGGGRWSAVRTADGSAAPQRFWWASVAKMVTAATVLRLAEDGRLSLSDPISRYIADVPNGDSITIEHLLVHTSGLFSANEDPRVRAGKGGPLSLKEELAVLRRHGAMFCPGERWRYSNSGYGLLGVVIEKVEGRPFVEAATARVLAPLGAASIRLLSPGEAAADVAPLPSGLGEGAVQPSWTGPAGGLAGQADDMNRLLQAILAPGFLKDETRRLQLARAYSMFDVGTYYGLGMMIYQPPGTNIYWIGHSGGSPGANAITVWSPQDGAFVSVALTGEGSATATANLLLSALRGAQSSGEPTATPPPASGAGGNQ